MARTRRRLGTTSLLGRSHCPHSRRGVRLPRPRRGRPLCDPQRLWPRRAARGMPAISSRDARGRPWIPRHAVALLPHGRRADLRRTCRNACRSSCRQKASPAHRWSPGWMRAGTGRPCCARVSCARWRPGRVGRPSSSMPWATRRTRPSDTLAHAAAVAERLRTWHPAVGDFDDYTTEVLADSRPDPGREADWPAVVSPVDEWTAAWSAVPPGRAARPAVRSTRGRFDACLHRAADEVRAHRGAVGRYLAARAFASWCAYQGSGLRSHIASVRTSLGVLMVEVARESRRRTRGSADQAPDDPSTARGHAAGGLVARPPRRKRPPGRAVERVRHALTGAPGHVPPLQRRKKSRILTRRHPSAHRRQETQSSTQP